MMDDPEANKALIRRAYQVCIDGRQLERASEFYADDYVGHLGGLYEAHGPKGYQEAARGTLTAFPDAKEAPEEIIAEGDRVVVRHQYRGTHQAPFLGIEPTGKEISITVIDIYRVAGGKIVEEFSQIDLFGLLRLLGAAITQPAACSA
jgi:predicted ester cyclase